MRHFHRSFALVLCTIALGCASNEGERSDSAATTTAGPDTTAIHGAGHAPHTPPGATDSVVDTTRRPR